MDILIPITTFAIGTVFGFVLCMNIFCYLVNKLDIWIAPDGYVKRKIDRKRNENWPDTKKENAS